ncbi:MAG TPA: ABC transporter permease [Bryobacteraceae bacterium]|jgi:putative ABC transport system permease protein
MKRLLSDVRLACRGLARAPGFAIVAILTLALGIGANTAMFSVAQAALWRPMPVGDPGRLVHLWETNPLKHWTDAPASPANFADWEKRNHVFSGMAAYLGAAGRAGTGFDIVLTGYGEPRRLMALIATGNLFRILDVSPLMGRTFRDEETFASDKRVTVLSWQLWQTALGGDPNIVGKTIMLNSRPYDVIGVMPREFYFPSRAVQLWTTPAFTPSVFVQQRRPHYLDVVARLKPGVDIAQARAEMTGIAAQLEREHPDNNTKMGVGLGPLQDWFTDETRPGILMLLGAVGFLLLIVCANVANLQISRATARSRELAIRRALGATRGQIVQQLAVESVVLAVCGGVLGVVLALAAKSALLAAMPSLPGVAPLHLDAAMLLFVLGLSIVTAIAFGVGPALACSGSESLAERGGTGTAQSRRLRSALVASEVALSVILVSGAGLFTKSLLRLEHVNPGFQVEHGLMFNIALPSVRYPKASQAVETFHEIERRLRENPQVRAVGLARAAALNGTSYTTDTTLEGHGGDDYQRELHCNAATPEYFRALGTPLAGGRWLTEQDEQKDAPPVTLVNEALKNKYFGGADPVGKRMKFGRPLDKGPWVTIVGVVADTKQDGLSKAVQPEVYVPFSQDVSTEVTFIVRSTGAPETLTAAAREAVHQVDKDLVLADVKTLAGQVHAAAQSERFRSTVLAGFAAAALLLAGIGIYGVLAYLVALRTREIGVRMALGARVGQLVGLVFEQGMRPVAIGLGVGLVAALGVTRLIRALLFGVDASDPGTYLTAIAILGIVAAAACTIPAMRAARVDPIVALRDE